MISLTIIIPTLNHTDNSDRMRNIERARKECLTSLVETVPDVPIILVSNGGEPREMRELGEVGDVRGQIKRMHLWEQNQGMAVNAGVATVNTEWVLVTNDDMIYVPGWLSSLIDRSVKLGSSDNLIQCISPKLIEPRPGAVTFETYFCGGAGGDFDKQKWLEFASKYQNTEFIRTGFNLPFLIKRELWDLISGYDINYGKFGSNSDSDLEYKIRLAGVQPYQNPRCIVYHFSGTSGSFAPENQSYWQQNWNYFISKWGFERVSSPSIWTADFKIPWDKLKYRPTWAKIPVEKQGQ